MHNLLTFIFFIIALVLFIYKIQARTADDIIEKHLAAIGGTALINDIYNIRMTGTRQMMENLVPVKVTKVNGKLFRTDFIMMKESGFLIINQSEGWNFIPILSDKTEQINNETYLELRDELDIAGPLVDYISKNNKIKLLGKEELNGNDVYKIQLTMPSSRTITYLIDRQNYLIIQTREMKNVSSPNSKNKYVEVITDFSDYKRIEGVLFPHKISNPGYGPLTGATSYDNIEVNQKLPDNIFLPQPLILFNEL